MKYLITGTKRGLGASLANECYQRGHEITALTKEQWDVRNSYYFAKDVMFDRVIVNAAIKDDNSPFFSDPAKVLDVLNVNAVGALRTVQAVNEHLREGAKIAIMTSQMGSSDLTGAITLHGRYGDHRIEPTYSIGYRMSKAALNKLSQCLAVDLRSRGVSVYAIDPGWLKTAMGGSFANMDVDQSAVSILDTIERLSIEDTGIFCDWAGNKLEW